MKAEYHKKANLRIVLRANEKYAVQNARTGAWNAQQGLLGKSDGRGQAVISGGRASHDCRSPTSRGLT